MTAKHKLVGINLLGGSAVLVSYAHGLSTHPATRAELWGGVPQGLRPWYTLTMLLAATGYFAFSYFVFFRLDPKGTQIAGRFGFRLFNGLYALILVPSALWMPLTFEMLTRPSDGLWLIIRLVLALVALGSLGLLVTLLTLRPRRPAWAYRLALAGSLAFCVQTVLLDALIWPAYFPA